MKLYLASTSAFKKSIFDKVKMKCTQIESNFSEGNDNRDNVYNYVMDMSYGKAHSIEEQINDGIIIGLDCVCLINGKIVEKPKSTEEAKNNLKESANTTSSVVTGITLINKETNEIVKDYQETKIEFRQITNDDLEYYISNEPYVLDASGFLLETIASNFLKSINGSYYNILGVPVEKIYELLQTKWNIHLKDIE